MSDFANARIEQVGNNYNVSYGDDRGLFVEFALEPQYMGKKSEDAGRAIYEDVEYIRITFAGDKTKQIYCPVNDEYRNRFHSMYQKWKETGETPVEGTRLELCAMYRPSEIAELKAMKIHTVEQLAAIPDSALSSGLGFRSMRDKAIAYLGSANGGATKLVADNEAMKAELAALKEQINQLSKKPKKED